ncbi:MAG: class I SAM-dependent methyltransferase [Candidatus Heimdallarchaeota archaeon]|nr:MAG: class I SAM-dependent methyltransferase [Candidatus Heimdallarchaeota archaeon]
MKAPFSGWDFSVLSQWGGNPEDPLPWSYDVTVKRHLSFSNSMLDMGTGGGEFLSSLIPLPSHTYATEAYKPNVSIAKEKLEPLGVKVIEIAEGKQEESPLPFDDGFFDLVINRHECYESDEVYRILKPNGTFITQQVGQQNNEDLRKVFGSVDSENEFTWNLKTALNTIKQAGFTILGGKEHIGFSRFYDIRTLVFLLKILPWEFPNFSIDKYEGQLFHFFRKLINDGYFDSISHRFFIIAQKQ